MLHIHQEESARRTSEGSGFRVQGSGGAHARPFDPHLRLSEAAAAFLGEQELQAGNRLRTLQDYATSIWYLIEFAGADLEVGQLPADFARRWIEWLRQTPARPRKAWSRPRITPDSVEAFFQNPPPRREDGKARREQTIGRFWRMARPFLVYLGIDVALPKKRRGSGNRDHAPRLSLPPPLVPRRSEISAWWRDILDPANGHATASLRRRVVWVQAVVLLTGCRIGELLSARSELVEGHWLLLHPESVKTGRPRLVYVTGQALAIAAALRAWSANGQGMLFDPGGQSDRFIGWQFSESWWHKTVQSCRPAAVADGEVEKRHQALRRACSTWLELRDPVAEAAQLGHGRGDVVSAHYLDVLRRLPRRMEKRPLHLPDLEDAGLRWPAPIEADRHVPKRLYAAFRRMVEE